jgi:hypothetical protein
VGRGANGTRNGWYDYNPITNWFFYNKDADKKSLDQKRVEEDAYYEEAFRKYGLRPCHVSVNDCRRADVFAGVTIRPDKPVSLTYEMKYEFGLLTSNDLGKKMKEAQQKQQQQQKSRSSGGRKNSTGKGLTSATSFNFKRELMQPSTSGTKLQRHKSGSVSRQQSTSSLTGLAPKRLSSSSNFSVSTIENTSVVTAQSDSTAPTPLPLAPPSPIVPLQQPPARTQQTLLLNFYKSSPTMPATASSSTTTPKPAAASSTIQGEFLI